LVEVQTGTLATEALAQAERDQDLSGARQQRDHARGFRHHATRSAAGQAID
jgi:hypothetical protein